MCGVVATQSPASNIVPILLEGVRKLEYRSYDSASIAVLNGAGVQRVRAAASPATHGTPSKRNAPPHVSGSIADRLRIADASGPPVQRLVVVSQLSADAVELGHYRHYMQKEIFEQPEALANRLELIGSGGRLQPGVFDAEAASRFPETEAGPNVRVPEHYGDLSPILCGAAFFGPSHGVGEDDKCGYAAEFGEVGHC